MNFETMYTELSDRVSAYDSSVSTDLTKLKRWINLAQQDVCSYQNWPFMLYHEIIQTVPDITTGTISISAASTSLTFSSAPASSVANYFIKFSSESDWYKVSSHTAASTSATITPAYGGSSSLSGATYTLRKLWYTTSSPLDSILDIKKTVSGKILESANSRDTDMFLSLYWDSGETYKYISSIPDSTGGVRFSLIYSPSSTENLQVRGIKVVSDLSATTDTSIIPSRWHSVVLDMASFYALSSLDDTRAEIFFNKAEKGIFSMAQTFGYDLGRHRVTRSMTDAKSSGPAYSLPSQYGVLGG